MEEKNKLNKSFEFNLGEDIPNLGGDLDEIPNLSSLDNLNISIDAIPSLDSDNIAELNSNVGLDLHSALEILDGLSTKPKTLEFAEIDTDLSSEEDTAEEEVIDDTLARTINIYKQFKELEYVTLDIFFNQRSESLVFFEPRVLESKIKHINQALKDDYSDEYSALFSYLSRTTMPELMKYITDCINGNAAYDVSDIINQFNATLPMKLLKNNLTTEKDLTKVNMIRNKALIIATKFVSKATVEFIDIVHCSQLAEINQSKNKKFDVKLQSVITELEACVTLTEENSVVATGCSISSKNLHKFTCGSCGEVHEEPLFVFNIYNTTKLNKPVDESLVSLKVPKCKKCGTYNLLHVGDINGIIKYIPKLLETSGNYFGDMAVALNKEGYAAKNKALWEVLELTPRVAEISPYLVNYTFIEEVETLKKKYYDVVDFDKEYRLYLNQLENISKHKTLQTLDEDSRTMTLFSDVIRIFNRNLDHKELDSLDFLKVYIYDLKKILHIHDICVKGEGMEYELLCQYNSNEFNSSIAKILSNASIPFDGVGQSNDEHFLVDFEKKFSAMKDLILERISGLEAEISTRVKMAAVNCLYATLIERTHFGKAVLQVEVKEAKKLLNKKISLDTSFARAIIKIIEDGNNLIATLAPMKISNKDKIIPMIQEYPYRMDNKIHQDANGAMLSSNELKAIGDTYKQLRFKQLLMGSGDMLLKIINLPVSALKGGTDRYDDIYCSCLESTFKELVLQKSVHLLEDLNKLKAEVEDDDTNSLEKFLYLEKPDDYNF